MTATATVASTPDLPNGIRQRGSAFVVDVCVKGLRSRASYPTLEEALAQHAKTKPAVANAAARKAAATAVWTLGQAFEETHANIWKGSKSEESSVRNAKVAVNYFKEHTPLTEISTDWINQFASSLRQKEHAAGSVNRKLAALSKMLRYAHPDHLPSLPKINRKKEAKTKVRSFTRQEEVQMLALFDQWGKDEHSEALCVLIDTGFRPSELWKVRPGNVLWETNVIKLEDTKNGEDRCIPMTQRVQEIIKRRLELSTGPTAPVFPFDNHWFGRAFDRAKAVMGLEHDEFFTPYTLRKTCCTRLIKLGVPLTVVQKWMGHKTITVTMRYASESPEDLFAAVKRLEEL